MKSKACKTLVIMAGHPTPPLTSPPRNKGFIMPYFPGGGGTLRGCLISHKVIPRIALAIRGSHFKYEGSQIRLLALSCQRFFFFGGG